MQNNSRAKDCRLWRIQGRSERPDDDVCEDAILHRTRGVRGERYSASADVFSLAIVPQQIDTLQHPRTGVNYTAVEPRLRSFRPAIRDGVPERILSILKACTRYENNAQFGGEGDLTYGRHID